MLLREAVKETLLEVWFYTSWSVIGLIWKILIVLLASTIYLWVLNCKILCIWFQLHTIFCWPAACVQGKAENDLLGMYEGHVVQGCLCIGADQVTIAYLVQNTTSQGAVAQPQPLQDIEGQVICTRACFGFQLLNFCLLVLSTASSTNHSNSSTVLRDKGHYPPHAFCLCFTAQAAVLDPHPLCSVILRKAWGMTTECGAGQQAESSTGERWINDCLFWWFLCGLHEIAIVNLKLQSTSSGKILQSVVISNLLKAIGGLSWNQSSHFQSAALPEAAGSLSPFDTFLMPETKASLQIPVQ